MRPPKRGAQAVASAVFVLVCLVITSQPTLATADGSGAFRWPLHPLDPLRTPLLDTEYHGIPVDSLHIPPMPAAVRAIHMRTSVDSSHQFITITYRVGQDRIFYPIRMPVDDFVRLKGRQELAKLWRTTLLKTPEDELLRRRRRRNQGVRIDLPVEIRSKTFQTLFGGSKVGLSVTGDITIDGGFRHEKRSQVKTALTQGSDYNFKMEQKQRFGVEGHIGEKVKVRVDQDSERPFDFENTIRLQYQGFEDEIITSIEAGNISLSLPATRFVTFSGRNSGLFGIKAQMALGNLKITTIASQEKGESKKLSLSGGAQENTQKIEDYQYRRGAYFFLDRLYREQFRHYTGDGLHEYNPDFAITRIELYKSEAGYDTRYSDSIRGWAVIDEHPDSLRHFDADTTGGVDQNHYLGYFRRMEKTEYFVDRDLGYVQLNMPVRDGEVLAVAFETRNGRRVGDIDFNPDSSTTIMLRLLKPMKPTPKDSTWVLEWKNVYYLGASNIQKEGFELKIYYKPPSGDPQETQQVGGKAKTYLEIFGLDRYDQNGNRQPDGVIDFDPNIINLARGELIFPDLQPFDPIGIYVDGKLVKPELDSLKYSPVLYDTTSQTAITAASKFYIEVKSKNKSANYQLGFNIIEGSEVVTLNGRQLQRGTDYVIDYYTGNLTILNEEATLPTADVQITYESNQMFQLEKKTMIGTRAQYDFGQDRFIGGTLLYMNQSTLERKIRVGQGPMRNLVWDINGKLGFQPNFLTKAVNFLPFVETQAPSKLNVEGEIAQVLPNPNTSNNKDTGDPSGVAYIDDFEGSKRTIGLSIMRRAWTLGSAPAKFYQPGDPLTTLRMGHVIWYNPWEQVPIKEIWPNRDVNPNVPQRVHVLTIEFTPADSSHLPPGSAYYFPADSSWGAIMQALSAGYHDQTESKFLEVLVQGNEGVLHIDLGQISEDIIPNGKLDTEDKAPAGGFRNGLLDEGEDVGLDGMKGKDPSDFWDINRNGVRDPGEPLSLDDWDYQSGSYVYDHIDGTEKNANDEGGRRPDTEDINGNGAVDLANNYFEYTIDLDKTSPDTAYISGGNPDAPGGGWYQYRIPLDDLTHRKDIGNPDFTRIESIRLWFEGFKNRGTIRIAELNLVGNDWKEKGVASPADPENYDATDDSTVAVTVVNTHDNPEYKPPKGVAGEIDPVTRVQAKEQALVLKVTNLQPGYSGLVQKTFFSPQNYIHYEKMKMYVYGRDPFGVHIRPDTSYIEFFFRFGSDLNNYYEIRERVYPGWDDRNEIVIDLLDLSAVKLDTARYDSIQDVFIKRLPGGKEYRIKGRPSLTNVRMLAAGVRNLMGATLDTTGVTTPIPFTGEIWMNELRLSYVKKERGKAMRARVDFGLADVLSLNAEINRQDADFHDIKTRFGRGDNRFSTNFNARLSLDKLLPAWLGFSIPVSYKFGYSKATPKYKPGTDIEVDKDSEAKEKDSKAKKILETIQSRQEQSGFSVSIRRSTKSKNWILANTIDRISGSYSETRSQGSNSRTKSSSNFSQSGRFGYNLSFGRGKFFQPFAWIRKVPVLGVLGQTKLYYTPKTFSVQASVTRSRRSALTRTGALTGSETFNVQRQLRAGYNLFETLGFDFNKSWVSDMRGQPLSDLWHRKFGQITGINQNFSIKYNPKVFAWLTNNFSYSAGYKYNVNLQQRTTGRSAANNANLSAQLGLDPARLWNAIFRSGTTARRRPGARPVRGRRPPGARRAPPGSRPKPGSKGKTKGTERKKSGSPFHVFRYLGKVFEMIDPIQFSIQQRTGNNYYGLQSTRMPTTAFQFGLSDSTGVPVFQNVGTNRGSQSFNKAISVQTGISPMRSMSITLRYNHSEQRNSTTTTTGGFNETYLRLGDFDMPFPNWTLRWSGLSRIKPLRKYVQQLTVDHSFNGQRNEAWTETQEGTRNVTKRDFQSGFRPLVGVNARLKNGVNITLRYNMSENLSKSMTGGLGSTKQVAKDLNFTVTYSKRSGFRLPFWKNKELRNSIDFSLNVVRSSNVTYKSRGAEGRWQRTAETFKWTVEPRVTYSFSTQVRGGAHLQIGRTKNLLMGDTKIQELGINVQISIRGS